MKITLGLKKKKWFESLLAKTKTKQEAIRVIHKALDEIMPEVVEEMGKSKTIAERVVSGIVLTEEQKQSYKKATGLDPEDLKRAEDLEWVVEE